MCSRGMPQTTGAPTPRSMPHNNLHALENMF
jgi:hypothetical protein